MTPNNKDREALTNTKHGPTETIDNEFVERRGATRDNCVIVDVYVLVYVIVYVVVFVYVYIYVYVHVYVYVFVYAYAYVFVCSFVYMFVSVSCTFTF